MAMGPPDAAAILIFILLLGFSSPSQAAMKNSRTNLIPDGDFQDILYAPSMYNVKLEKKNVRKCQITREEIYDPRNFQWQLTLPLTGGLQ